MFASELSESNSADYSYSTTTILRPALPSYAGLHMAASVDHIQPSLHKTTIVENIML